MVNRPSNAIQERKEKAKDKIKKTNSLKQRVKAIEKYLGIEVSDE